jgi:Zn finger protein HypA/HybF involved in hydrogenase expression
MAHIINIQNIKCPKCNSNTFTLTEVHFFPHTRNVENGVCTDNEDIIGYPEPEGKVVAECDECKHIWKLKKVTSMLNINGIKNN